ncbi:3'-5' exonuclease [Epilithonimonas caeni]|uniref:3'-5' exonuclease n=1 Tax=Epilithonimonas caeni TaxID=365343 RepID=UPI000419E5AC|nr:3'-5' exonuclease [Epilithonimonas caeni]
MKAFLDIETGGFSINKNGVCEIAVVITDNNLVPVEEFHSLIKPYLRECGTELVSYKDDSMAVNGITIEDLETKGRDVCDVIYDIVLLLKLHSQTEKIVLVGHNSTIFDIPRIQHLCNRFHHEKDFFINFLQEDTMKIAKGFLNLPSYSLENLCSHFQIVNEKAHSALSDTYSTIELYKKLVG